MHTLYFKFHLDSLMLKIAIESHVNIDFGTVMSLQYFDSKTCGTLSNCFFLCGGVVLG